MQAQFSLATLLDLIPPLASNVEDPVTHPRMTNNESNLKTTKAPKLKKVKGTKSMKAPKVEKVKVTKSPKKSKRL